MDQQTLLGASWSPNCVHTSPTSDAPNVGGIDERQSATHMNRLTFAILCHLLKTVASLSSIEIVNVEKMVVMFLHVLAYVNYLEALNETYIKVNVAATDRPMFIVRKEGIATNVLGVCDTKGDFVYVLAGWEGSAADSWILHDALVQPNELQVPKGYLNAKEFLAPYIGHRYHLQEWRDVENALTTANKYFKMKHPSVRNMSERAFGLLKGRWQLRGKLYYPLQVKCCIILACCLLHNLINRKMTNCEDIDDVRERDFAYAMATARDDIKYIETTTSGFSGGMN
ncbi:retrotransposon protein [Cucumis melo var. makuwa]|uniref:Retrotransposon protein n=1 Tax=Cucumis melo var. makuwa TaxID=1194695 RepID=A0A5A7VE15_CUCMM|nr:retrotransposon protein [Cucumis melo var. makuwa]TYK05511.1 retrotransposon protein [Cucumis melo var. makuwa]